MRVQVRAPVRELDRLLEQAHAIWLLGGSIVCHVEGADLSVVEAVARILLTAQRVQGCVTFHAEPDTAELLVYCGLVEAPRSR